MQQNKIILISALITITTLISCSGDSGDNNPAEADERLTTNVQIAG
ncbi:MAG: hypothetical protein HQL49_05595 [Gammaproteobacteria bacterium]|nr:hypothetical protein [Gammaproteobacteria bacterium]